MSTTDTLANRYRQWRKRGYPARSALACARAETKDYDWQPEQYHDPVTWTCEREGFLLTLKLEPDDWPDMSTYGEFVHSRAIAEYYSVPEDDDTPLRLPAAHFRYQGYTQSDWGFFFPAYVEDDFKWLRTKGGYARQPAREEITRRIEELCAKQRELTSYVATVTASRNGIELGSDTLGGMDFYEANDWELFGLVEDHGMADEAITEAQDNLASLTT